MTVTIVEDDGMHRAVVAVDGTGVWCCEAGHAEAEAAAEHAFKLTSAMAHRAKRAA